MIVATPKENFTDLWVNYADIGLNFTYTSCMDGEVLPPSLWAPGEPNNHDGREPCVVLRVCHGECMGLYDVPCDTLKFALCQVIKGFIDPQG